MENVKNKQDIFLSGNLFKNIFIYSLPIILSGVLQLLYNATDLIVCGQFGLALSYPVSWLVTASVHFIFFLVFYKKTVKIYDLNYQTKTA